MTVGAAGVVPSPCPTGTEIPDPDPEPHDVGVRPRAIATIHGRRQSPLSTLKGAAPRAHRRNGRIVTGRCRVFLLAALPPYEIVFNYLGQAEAATDEGSLFHVSTTGTGPNRSPRARRTYPLEIVGIVTQGRLRITLTYSSRTHRRATAERLAAAYAGALRELLEQSRESEEVFTPSDFAKARLDAKSFARVAALLADSD